MIMPRGLAHTKNTRETGNNIKCREILMYNTKNMKERRRWDILNIRCALIKL